MKSIIKSILLCSLMYGLIVGLVFCFGLFSIKIVDYFNFEHTKKYHPWYITSGGAIYTTNLQYSGEIKIK